MSESNRKLGAWIALWLALVLLGTESVCGAQALFPDQASASSLELAGEAAFTDQVDELDRARRRVRRGSVGLGASLLVAGAGAVMLPVGAMRSWCLALEPQEPPCHDAASKTLVSMGAISVAAGVAGMAWSTVVLTRGAKGKRQILKRGEASLSLSPSGASFRLKF